MGGRSRPEGGEGVGPARLRTWTGPAPNLARPGFFLRRAMGETSAVRRNAPMSSAAKVQHVLANGNQLKSHI